MARLKNDTREYYNIGRVLKSLRIINEKSISEMAKMLGLSQVYVGELERGEKSPSDSTLQKYSVQLNIPLQTLKYFAERNEKENPTFKNLLFIILRKIERI